MDIKAPLDEVDDMDIANRYGTPIRNADRAELRAFATLIRAAALEEAAKVCEENAAECIMLIATEIDDTPREVHSRECAAAIRALIVPSEPAG
jgi:hypothetical protein